MSTLNSNHDSYFSDDVKRAAKDLAILFAVMSVLTGLTYSQLHSLESGTVESVTVWGPVAWAYECLGFYGAMSVFPCVFLLCVLEKIVTIFRLGHWIAMICCWGFAAALGLLGVGLFVVTRSNAPEGMGTPQFVFCGFLVLLGMLFALLGWHNRPDAFRFDHSQSAVDDEQPFGQAQL